MKYFSDDKSWVDQEKFDEETRAFIYDAIITVLRETKTYEQWMESPSNVLEAVVKAIPPFAMRTDDGRFVLMEESRGEVGESWYRVLRME